MQRPLVYTLLALLAGILLGSYLITFNYIFSGGMVIILIGLVVTLRKQWTITGYALFFIFVIILGIGNSQRQLFTINAPHQISRHVDAGKITLEGVVADAPAFAPEKNYLSVECVRLIGDNNEYPPVSGNIRLVLPPDLFFDYGDLIRFQTSLKKIQNFKNPGGFNYERYLKMRGITAVGFVPDNSRIVLLRKNVGNPLRSYLESFRTRLRDIIRQNAPAPERGIITAMTIGMQNEIPPAVTDSFSKTGTSHILSISGLHVGMVAAATFFLIMMLLKSSEYLMLKFNIIKVATVGSFILIIIYALIAGMGIPVVRSTLMAIAFLSALLLNRERDLYNIVALAALLILFFWPAALFDISFQLSFAAVIAIIYITPRFTEIKFPFISDWPLICRKIFRETYLLIIVSLAATIGTLPLIIYYFNRLSTVTVIANLIAIPLLGIAALTLAMAAVLFAVFSATIAGLFIKLSSFFVGLSLSIINALASLPWSSISIIKPTVLEIVIFYFLLFLVIVKIDLAKKTAKKVWFFQHPRTVQYLIIIIIAFFVCDIGYIYARDKFPTNLRLTAIDVGQGAATLVRFPGGQKMLIDGGGFAESTFDMGKMVVAPFLYSERISTIDIVVLTHPHPDHFQGLIYILDNFNVREFWHNGQMALEDESYNQLNDIIARRKIKTEILTTAAPPKTIGDAAIQILWPKETPQSDSSLSTHDAVNDASLVMKIKYGKRSFLLTGDISAKVEKAVIQSAADLASDILLLPHHGSAHSSSPEFISAVGARYVAASVGKNNVFRHPHPSVMERYKKADTEIFRTDQDGAITFTTDGISLTKDTFVKKR